MATKIRLKRMGAKKAPFYRVVICDSRYPRDGRFIEEIGFYDPLCNPAKIQIDAERANKWLVEGAQPSETVKSLFKKAGINAQSALFEEPIAVDEEPVEISEGQLAASE